MTRVQLSSTEFNPYYEQYINQVAQDTPLLDALKQSGKKTVAFFEQLDESLLTHRYEAGKWTPKEVVQHLIDTERVFSYRALRFARNDKAGLIGFEQDDFVSYSQANNRSLASLLQEYKAVRQATIALFEGIDQEAQANIGMASDSPLSARAAGFITAGHDLHHIQIIEERYL